MKKYKSNNVFNIDNEMKSQMMFKKIVRPSWISQVQKFHKFDKQKILRRLRDFAESNQYRIKVQLSSLA